MARLNKTAFFLICATVVFTTLAYGAVHQPVIALFYLIVATMVLLWAADCYVSGAVRFSRSPLQIPLLLFGLYGMVQIIPFGAFADAAGLTNIPRTISFEPFATQLTVVHIFVLCSFYAVALVYLESAGRLRQMVTVITIFGFIYAFYAILQSVLSPEKIYGIYGLPFSTPFGSFVNRNDFAAIIEMTVGVPLGMIFAGAVSRDKRLLYVVAIILMAAALLLSGSRGGLVAFVSEIIIVIILTTRTKGRKSVILKATLSLLLVAAAVGGAMFVGGDTSLTRFTATSLSPDITSNRSVIWRSTLKMIVSNFPLGSGLGAYAQAFTPFDTLSGTQRVEQAHNDYLQVLADAGVVGLVIGALFLFYFFREGIRNTRAKNTLRRGVAVGAFAGCFAILIHSVFDFVLHITAISVMFLTLMALLVASGRKSVDDIEDFDEISAKRRNSASVTSISQRSRKSPNYFLTADGFDLENRER